MLKTLRQPRYATLGALMLIVAIICVAAGTWQIARFEQKRHENDALRANAAEKATTADDVLPLVGAGPAPSEKQVEFRTVRVTGRYDAGAQTLVRSRTVREVTGYLVLTPLRTPTATLLVVRGFVPQPASGGVPTPAPPPSGVVTVVGRTHAPETPHDAAAQLNGHQVQSINPAEQAARLGGSVFNGYAELEAGQPGTRGLHALPKPNLSNPAGGALEPQHFAYVVQWYLFAALALAAPFAMARAENKTKRVVDLAEEMPAEMIERAGPSADELRAAKLTDRYGRAR